MWRSELKGIKYKYLKCEDLLDASCPVVMRVYNFNKLAKIYHLLKNFPSNIFKNQKVNFFNIRNGFTFDNCR